MTEGIFPKVDGNIYFAKDANLTFGITENFEQELISVTTTSLTATFSQSYTRVLLHNRGVNACHVNFGAAATTDNFTLEPNERITVYGVVSDVRAITVSGTTELHILGLSSITASDSVSVNKLDVTTTTASVAISTDSCFVLIKNTGVNSAYINFNGAATTNHIEIEPKSTLTLGLEGINAVHAITESSTTTLNIISSTEI